MKNGIVYLIGAGPGDPGLISLKAMNILNSADCVIYDYLASFSFVEKLVCEKIFVGKKGSDHTMPQEEINRLLVSKASEGKRIARLKGGDPFIFGRGGEEAEELLKAGIRCEIVPGISSFYSAPAYAGIPLTHRDYASSFEVITGHRKDEKSEEDINFPEFNENKTFVFLMGMKNLEYISTSLISKKDFPADTPAAVISWGTTPEQKAVTGSLYDISEKAKLHEIKAPAIIIIGGVVRLRDRLCWFEDLPLFGKKIVVTRTRLQASVLTEKLAASGARIIEFPVIEIKPRADLSSLLEAIDNIQTYSWIIFTSQNAVNIFFSELRNSSRDSRHLAGTKIAAIGPATANELRKYFIEPDFIPDEYIAEAVARELEKHSIKGKLILLPCASEARPALKDMLADAGAEVDRIHLYDTTIPEDISPDTLNEIESADIITFTSSSTVRNFFKTVKSTKAKLACIGPVTAKTLAELGYQADILAEEYTIDGLAAAIENHFR